MTNSEFDFREATVGTVHIVKDRIVISKEYFVDSHMEEGVQ